MKKLIYIFLLLLRFQAIAQQSWDSIYTHHTWSNFKALIESDSGNIIATGFDANYFIDSSGNYIYHQTGLLAKIDSNGRIIKRSFVGLIDSTSYSTFGDMSNTVFMSILHCNDDNYLTCAMAFPKQPVTNYDTHLYLIKMNENLDTIFTRDIAVQDTQLRVWNSCNLPNGAFAFVGDHSSQYIAGSNQGFLIITDSLGNLTNKKLFYTDPLPFRRLIFYGVTPTDDGGFLLSGAQDDLNGYSQPIIIKTNPQGEEEWRRTETINEGYNYAYEIIRTSDGNYAYVWFKQERINGRILYRYRMSKIDINGNLIWAKSYMPSYNIGIRLKERSNGELIIMGWYTDTIGSGAQGLIIRCNSNGDTLCTALLGFGLYGRLENGALTRDGSYIFCGDAYCCNLTQWGYTSSAWVGRLDSLGLLISIDDPDKVPVFTLVYPNPATTEIKVVLKYPDHIPFNQNMSIVIYDMQARPIMRKTVDRSNNETVLSIESLAPGNYIVVLDRNGTNGGGKIFVKQ